MTSPWSYRSFKAVIRQKLFKSFTIASHPLEYTVYLFSEIYLDMQEHDKQDNLNSVVDVKAKTHMGY